MNILKSATRIVLIYFALVSPILLWFGKIPTETFTNALMLVLGAFFAIKGITGTPTEK